MTDDGYLQFFTSCKTIDAGQVSPTVPECCGARLDPPADLSLLGRQMVACPAAEDEMPWAPTGHLARSSSWCHGPSAGTAKGKEWQEVGEEEKGM